MPRPSESRLPNLLAKIIIKITVIVNSVDCFNRHTIVGSSYKLTLHPSSVDTDEIPLETIFFSSDMACRPVKIKNS